MPYKVVFASERVEREFEKALRKIPNDYQASIAEAIRSLGQYPRPGGKKLKKLKGRVPIAHLTAQYRIRIGPYRMLYDVDDGAGKVVLLKLVRRNERTYG